MKDIKKSLDEMKISVVTPVKNESSNIALLLRSLLSQEVMPEEIIVADGGSQDGTPEIVESFIKEGHPVRLFRMEHAYPGIGRNIAIENSKNDTIAMIDGGIIAERTWLKELSKVMKKDPSIDFVFGNCEPITDTYFKKCLSVILMPIPRYINGKLVRGKFISSCLIKKSVWRTVGGFRDLRAAEDRIFIEEVEKRGFKTIYAPEAVVHWLIPANPRETFDRYYTYSMHDMIAKRGKDWQYPVLRLYLVGLGILTVGIFYSKWTLSVLFLCIFLRAISIIREKKKPFSFTLKELFWVVFIMLLVDMAMFAGMFKYFFNKYFKPTFYGLFKENRDR